MGIYSDKENVGKLGHALYSIKRSMQWDEDVFGLECDLDLYNIVATNDFNMGAMENKGLNIFNSAYVLADSKSATDSDFEHILGDNDDNENVLINPSQGITSSNNVITSILPLSLTLPLTLTLTLPLTLY